MDLWTEKQTNVCTGENALTSTTICKKEWSDGKMHYYGVIVNVSTFDTDRIDGEHEYKPPIEHGGWFCTCHWFDSQIKQLRFQLGAEKIFVGMMEKGKTPLYNKWME